MMAVGGMEREGSVAQVQQSRIDEALGWLSELARLEPDWDSYGAPRPSPEVIEQARRFIQLAVARLGQAGVPHEVMPIADGGISLEWRHPGIEVGLNACPEGGWTSLLVKNDEGRGHYDEGYDLSDDDALARIARVVANPPTYTWPTAG